MTLAQALILSGDSDQAADVCREGISLADGYGSAVDVARFGLVLGRARQCGADYEAAVCALEPAASTFQLAGLVLDELTARSLLAACCFSAGDKAAAGAQSELVSRLLSRQAGSDAPGSPAIADFACTLAASAPAAGRPHRLIAS
jgi:Flp pilus assembly protein TadD